MTWLTSCKISISNFFKIFFRVVNNKYRKRRYTNVLPHLYWTQDFFNIDKHTWRAGTHISPVRQTWLSAQGSSSQHGPNLMSTSDRPAHLKRENITANYIIYSSEFVLFAPHRVQCIADVTILIITVDSR